MRQFPKAVLRSTLLIPVIFSTFLILSGCGSDTPVQSELSTELVSASPSSQNVDPGVLDAAFDHAQTISGLKAVLILRNGFIIKEVYFNGTTPNALLHVRSVTKSVSSTLIGIALERGLLQGLEQPLDELMSLGDLQGDKAVITLRNLLTMTGGFEWHEIGGNEFSTWVNSGDQVNYVLNKPLSDSPGTRFNYNSGATHLLSVILARATGMSVQEFADEALFEPLGITRRAWDRDTDGNYYGGHGLQLRPRGMAKFGLLFLGQGRMNETQVVASSWVDQATQTQVRLNSSYGPVSEMDYGYLWWLDSTREAYWAWGYGGQFIYCVPALNLVVVTASEWFVSGSVADQQEVANLDLIINRILPAVK